MTHLSLVPTDDRQRYIDWNSVQARNCAVAAAMDLNELRDEPGMEDFAEMAKRELIFWKEQARRFEAMR